MNSSPILPEKFEEAFQKIGWVEHTSPSKRYKIFVSPHNKDLWTRIPVNVEDPQYAIYQQKNTLLLLYAVGADENKGNVHDIQSQLRNYNYKLINRIEAKASLNSSAVPFELAKLIPEKNIDAFRYFYHTKTKKRSTIPIEKFELNHTEVGSFVIPISIIVDDNPNTLMPVASEMNIQIHNYLKAIDTLSQVPRNNPTEFANKVMADAIDSKIVKDIYGSDNSIARFKEKYADKIESVSIGSRGSMLLDFGLSEKEKTFVEVDLGGVTPIKEEYLEMLEQQELLANETSFTAHDVNIDVLVEAIDITGRAKFTVMSVDETELGKPFKAQSVQLPKAKLDQFARYFVNGDTITVRGDIEKSKGRVGQIIVDTLGSQDTSANSDDNVRLFGN